MKALIVREPFGAYAKGQAITDPDEMQTLADGGQAHFCTPTEIADGFFPANEAVKPTPGAVADQSQPNGQEA